VIQCWPAPKSGANFRRWPDHEKLVFAAASSCRELQLVGLVNNIERGSERYHAALTMVSIET
jgi:hypothetical protein